MMRDRRSDDNRAAIRALSSYGCFRDPGRAGAGVGYAAPLQRCKGAAKLIR